MESNPIVLLRKRAGMERAEFAQALGVTYQSLWQAEHGYRNTPRKVIAALGRFGYDAARIEADLVSWRTLRQVAAGDKLAATLETAGDSR